jgi:hypothetical protein
VPLCMGRWYEWYEWWGNASAACTIRSAGTRSTRIQVLSIFMDDDLLEGGVLMIL